MDFKTETATDSPLRLNFKMLAFRCESPVRAYLLQPETHSIKRRFVGIKFAIFKSFTSIDLGIKVSFSGVVA
jgi:hypothetical protein